MKNLNSIYLAEIACLKVKNNRTIEIIYEQKIKVICYQDLFYTLDNNILLKIVSDDYPITVNPDEPFINRLFIYENQTEEDINKAITFINKEKSNIIQLKRS